MAMVAALRLTRGARATPLARYSHLPFVPRKTLSPAIGVATLRRESGIRFFSDNRRIDGYLQYYGKLKNQEGMLRDAARVEGYRKGLEAVRSKIEGAVVMDIGTGSGILAMSAARCGAKKVYAIEASPSIARVASRLVRANGLHHVVEVIPKHLEEVTHDDIPQGSVDVIVSELFSHFLVGELGLQPVSLAKRQFLRPGGLVLPGLATLKLAPFEDKELGAELRARNSFWQQRDFYGFDLTSALPMALEQTLRENVVDVVDPDALLIPPAAAPGYELDLATPEDPEHWRRIAYEVKFPSREKDAVVDGLCGWWDVVFSDGEGGTESVLSTAPDAPPTVWAQCRFMLDKPMPVAASAKLTAEVDMRTHRGRESYSLTIRLMNRSTGDVAVAGPVELSDVYARHFAKPLPFPTLDGASPGVSSEEREGLPPARTPLRMT
eukprot:TRINITY_DN54881_c0_g1_i1.p1 TRINITY_DN54881_c0_g1~~TRINITY_DN54881_c0_g1_i1.p1  ORF type:complete len:437 (-),score=63.06 TRINITY_DN54881_c0_g1_i1:13-1323(-)